MDSRQAVVTLTLNPAIDLYASVDRVEPDRKLRCPEPRREPGGGGVNVSRAIRSLGGESLALWAKGGFSGGKYEELLDAEGVGHRPIPIAGETRENVIVSERSSDRHFRFNMPGPGLSAAEAEEILALVESAEAGADFLVASGSLPGGVDDGFYARVAERAGQAGSRVVLDSSGAPLRRAAESQCVYLLKPNLRELGELVGQEPRDDAEIEAAALELVERGCAEVVVVSLGAGGATLATKDAVERIRAPTVPIESKIGAGDSMVAGLVLALTRGESVSRAARFGVAAGAAAVMTPSTRLCRREDTERIFEGMAG